MITHRRPVLIFFDGGPDWLSARFKLMLPAKKSKSAQCVNNV
jgi:hypothetical protein